MAKTLSKVFCHVHVSVIWNTGYSAVALRRTRIELHEFDRKTVRILGPAWIVIILAAHRLDIEFDAMPLEAIGRCKDIVHLEANVGGARVSRVLDILAPAAIEQFDELSVRYLQINDPGLIVIVVNLEGFGQPRDVAVKVQRFSHIRNTDGVMGNTFDHRHSPLNEF